MRLRTAAGGPHRWWRSPGHRECVPSPSACSIIEKGVSVRQSGGAERLGNCRSATKTQRKLAPRRKVGMRAVSLGCWLEVRLASQRIYTRRDIFLLLDKAFPAAAGSSGGGGGVYVLPSVPCLSSPPATGMASCGKFDSTFCFRTAFLELSDDLVKPELNVLQLRIQPRPLPWSLGSFRKVYGYKIRWVASLLQL